MRTDSAPLLVDADGFRVRPSAVTSGASLCDFCGMIETCVLAKAAQRCDQFTPTLAFVPPISGIEGTFSTFRSSAIWYERARTIFSTHRRFALVNSQDGTLLGHAKTTGAYKGACSELLAKHAWTNHLCLGARIAPDQATAWLTRQIRNRMGQRYIKSPDQIGTVIYLEFDDALQRTRRGDVG